MEFLKTICHPSFWWLPLGALALFLALISLLRCVAGQRRGQELLRFSSLGCALFTMLSMFALVEGWVAAEDWSALLDCVPAMKKILTIAVAVGLGLHLAALFVEKTKR